MPKQTQHYTMSKNLLANNFIKKSMVEVFKTNVKETTQANMLLHLIHSTFRNYKANFDLEDCDNILRVEYMNGAVEANCLIELLNDYGYHAEILMDAL